MLVAMKNLNLVEFRTLEPRAVIEQLAVWSRTADLRSFAFIVQVGPSDHKLGLAGGYRRRPVDAHRALQLLERKLRWENSLKESV